MPKVLIAEDYMFNYLLLQKFLEKLNFEYVICDNGAKAIDELKNQDFDLVLMDLDMPVMNGIEAVKHIRKDFIGNKKEIPIIAITGHHKDEYFGNLNGVGFNDCLHKPIDLAVLKNKLYNYIASLQGVDEGTLQNTKIVEKELNLDYLYEFADGDKTFVKEMIELFITNVPVFVDNIKSAYKDEDWEKLRFNAHKFSPQLQFFGLKSIISDVDAIEEYAVKQIFADDIEVKIKNVEIYCKIAVDKLAAISV